MSETDRRRFLLGATSIACVALPLSVAARTFKGEMPWSAGAAMPPQPPTGRFLTADERTFIRAAVDRLIPADEFPSASELGVVEFIDLQLAGFFGRGEIFYLQGPFRQGLETQGYQSREPAWLYRQAMADIEAIVAREHDGSSFADLAEADQDDVLKRLEDGSLELPNASGTTFFKLLLQNTKEGYFGDPVYGGNRDMAAWKMLGFPGARYDYRPYVARHNEPLRLAPVSVAGFTIPSIEMQGH